MIASVLRPSRTHLASPFMDVFYSDPLDDLFNGLTKMEMDMTKPSPKKRKAESNQELQSQGWTFRPSVNVVTEKESYRVIVNLPGVDKSNINMTLDDNGLLEITAKQTGTKEETGMDGFQFTESFERQYHQKIRLPEDVMKDDIKAGHENGTVIVTLKRIPAPAETNKKSIIIE